MQDIARRLTATSCMIREIISNSEKAGRIYMPGLFLTVVQDDFHNVEKCCGILVDNGTVRNV